MSFDLFGKTQKKEILELDIFQLIEGTLEVSRFLKLTSMLLRILERFLFYRQEIVQDILILMKLIS